MAVRTEWLLPLAVALALSECSGPPILGPGQGGTDGQSSSAPTSQTSNPSASRSTSSTEDLLLQQQVQLQEGGDGVSPECDIDEETPLAFRTDPGVWLNNLFSHTEYPELTVLCLRGFSVDDPIEVVATAGNFRARTDVRPVNGTPEESSPLGYEEEPPTTLFDDGASLRVYTRVYGSEPINDPKGAFVSEMWQFFPPEAARNAIAEGQRLTLTATQGDRVATIEQPIPIPRTPDFYILTSPQEERRLVLIGYAAGSRVPIGLYRKDGVEPTAVLMRKLGSVTMPGSQVSAFEVPDDLLENEAPGSYCVLPPVTQEASCERLTNWPAYPGEVAPGDEGDDVRAWQVILIAAGVIRDTQQNRDGIYGPATLAAVEAYLEREDLTNPDGNGVLGAEFYQLLTEVVMQAR